MRGPWTFNETTRCWEKYDGDELVMSVDELVMEIDPDAVNEYLLRQGLAPILIDGLIGTDEVKH